MIPDIIVCWPRNNDYPLWREYIKQNRSFFNEIIVAFTETHQGDDYRDFVRQAMFAEHALFVDAGEVPAGKDWRDWATNQALLHSYNAQWVLFTEQDFFPNPGFWNDVYDKVQKGSKVIGVMDGQRIHPAFLLVHRDVLKNKEWDFGVIPDVADHFSKVIKQLWNLDQEIDLIPSNLWNHFSGLSQNFTMLTRGEQPNWKVEQFNQYLKDCLSLTDVPLDPTWQGRVAVYLREIKPE